MLRLDTVPARVARDQAIENVFIGDYFVTIITREKEGADLSFTFTS